MKLARILSKPIRNGLKFSQSRTLPSRTIGGQRTATQFQAHPRRTATTLNSPTGRLRGHIKDAQRDYPILFPFLLVGCAASISLLGLLAYDQVYRIDPKLAAYPDAVQERLRIALHFTHVQPDPDEAKVHFSAALKNAEEAGMDPFSKEVLGIRIRFAEMLEKFGRVKGAVELMNGIGADLEARLLEVDASNEKSAEVLELRKALLRGLIQNKVKMAALYETEYMQDPTSAKRTLSDAVGLVVKETKHAQVNGFSEDNAAGLTLAEIAAMLSQMGDLYATSGEEANAVQVYMLTLDPLRQSCNGTRTCKEVQILSNIASTMTVALKRPGATVNGKPVNKTSMEAARKAIIRWADQAIGAAEQVNPADRDQMCDLGLISAEMTKADLLLDSGQKQQASEMYRSLIPRLQEKNLDQLVGVAQQSLQRARQ